MGLDMYLQKKVYVKNWSHNPPEDTYTFLVKRGGKKLPKEVLNPKKIYEITEEVAYWRKANQIHNWFVKNVVDDEDTYIGEDTWVSRENLEKLLDVCEQVIKASKLVKGEIQNGIKYEDGKAIAIMEKGKYIKDPTVAQELLPTQEGFFFGSTEYNEWYLDDVKYTVKMLKEALKDTSDTGSFYYSASW